MMASEKVTSNPCLPVIPKTESPAIDKFMKRVLGDELYLWADRGRRTGYGTTNETVREVTNGPQSTDS